MSPEVQAERDRCAFFAGELAAAWERSADKMEAAGTFTSRAIWPPFKQTTFVAPGHARAARDIRAAAHGLRTVQRAITEGWQMADIEARHG